MPVEKMFKNIFAQLANQAIHNFNISTIPPVCPIQVFPFFHLKEPISTRKGSCGAWELVSVESFADWFC